MYFVVLAWVLLLAVGGSRAQSVELHPNCGQVNTVRMSSTSSVLATLRAYAFATSCFGYQFVSNDGTCTPSTAGYVNLTITQSNGATTSIRMTDLYRGSVLSSSLRFSTATTFTVTAYYPDTSCAATLYYSLYGTYSVQPPTSSTIAPYLVSDSPTYMVPGQTLQFNFEVLNPPSPALSNSSQRILLLPEGLLCSSNAASAYVQTGSPSITVTSATTFTWSTSATVNGMYRVCSWNSQDQQWFAAAIIQLFGGNPAYFKQTTTSSNRGTQTVTLTFSGYNLSPSTDSVVLLADDGTACQTGIKSDASITLNSLSTVDATHIAASISIALRNAPSSYVVCYYAASSKAWTSVPDFDTLTRDVIGNFSSTVTAAPTTAPATSMPLTTPAPAPAAGTPTTPSPPTPAPTLATPSPPASCPTAPYNSANIAVTTNQVVAVVVSGSSIPSTFATQVASFLCVTSSAIAITRFDSGDSTSTVYFQVQCSAAGNTCNSAERQAAFLAYYSTASLTSVQSASSQTFSGISVAAAADNNVKATQIGLGVGLGVAVVLLIIALVVLGVFIKRRRDRAARGEDDDEAHVVQGRVIEVNPVLNYPYPTPRRSTTNDDPYAASPIPALPEKTASAAMASAPRQDTDERDL